MSGPEPASTASSPVLTVCIPTYNRAKCLEDCLRSLEHSIRGSVDRVQVLVSDNASTDETPHVVEKWAAVFPIRYVRNATNIGGERNFFSSAKHATTEYVWIFGDDDEFGESAVAEVLRYIDQNCDVIITNYSSWSKDMNTMISPAVMSRKYDPEYHNPDAILATFGILMGYISSVVVRRRILLSVPASEYEAFVPYGFPFPYSVYSGLPRPTRLRFIAQPLLRRREYNSELLVECQSTWVKYFIEGPALVFEALRSKGYAFEAILGAKTRNLRDFGIRNLVAGFDNFDRRAARTMMRRHYAQSWRFWLVWLPFLLLPSTVVKIAVEIRNRVR